MNKKAKITAIAMLLFGVVAITTVYLHGQTVSVLQPAGEVAVKERNLMRFALGLSLLVIVPVFVLLGGIAWKYREGNAKPQKYTPDVAGNRWAEAIWWIIPTVLIGIISVITWRSSYALDPSKSLASRNPTLHVQVIALDWKWLFLYPGQHIATVNYVTFPVGTPVDFTITSDSVMNSFWVPQLGGQIYAMTGMSTDLNLMANKVGDYHGSSANISGKGFSGMQFTARATSQADFEKWVKSAQHAKPQLTAGAYQQLARPSQNNSQITYAPYTPNLYDTILMKYMMPMPTASDTLTPAGNPTQHGAHQ